MSTGRSRRRIFSIRLILSLATVCLITVTVAGVGWISERNTRAALVAETETRLLLEARNLALLAADALLGDYPELTLCPVVSEMQEHRSDLELAVVVDHESIIQGHDEPRNLGRAFEAPENLNRTTTDTRLQPGEALWSNEELLVARVPARHVAGQVVGAAIVGLRLSHVDNQIHSARREFVIITAALMTVGIICALLIISRLLRPIESLRAGLVRIGRGDLKTPIRLRDHTEIGMLADAFNDMAGQLSESRAVTQAREAEIVDTQKEVIRTLGDVVESRSNETANHTVRVGRQVYRLARLAGLPEEEAETLRLASFMHDLGKIGIPDSILNKPGRFNDSDREIMKSHSTIGYHILSQSERPILQAAAIVAHEHHEWWDGRGYPRGLKGEEIHIYGRLTAIADVFDALTSDRIYRPGMSLEKALKIMRNGRGTQFDERLLDLFLENLDDFLSDMEKGGCAPATEAEEAVEDLDTVLA